MGREHAFVLNTRMTEYKPAGHFNLTTVSSWPVAACAAHRITLSNLKNQQAVDRLIADRRN